MKKNPKEEGGGDGKNLKLRKSKRSNERRIQYLTFPLT